MLRKLSWTVIGFVLLMPLWGQKRPLGHDDYDKWNSIRGQTLSRDGRWLAFSVEPAVGDGTLFVKRTDGSVEHKYERGTSPRFSRDGRYVLFTIVPAKADVDKAKKEKKKPEEQPKNSLAIAALDSGETLRLDRIRQYNLPEEDNGWISYQLEPAPGEKKPEEKTEQQGDKPKKRKDHSAGNDLYLKNISTAKEIKLSDVSSSQWSKDGKLFVYAVSTKDGSGDGIYYYDFAKNERVPIMEGMAVYRNIAIAPDGKSAAFLSDKATYSDEKPKWQVFSWKMGSEARAAASNGDAGIYDGFIINERGSVRFSEKGTRLLFGVAPAAPEDPKEQPADDEKVNVDIWNWLDPLIQPQQLVQASSERNRTFDVMLDLRTSKLIQIETPEMPSASIADRGDGMYALASTNLPYQQLISWDDSYDDYYLIDLASGKRTKILEKLRMGASLSPAGKYVVWFDDVSQQWNALSTKTLHRVVVSKGVNQPLFNELNDVPAAAGSYGNAGFTDGDELFLIYDAYDIWATDPMGKGAPRNITEGLGRRMSVRFRIVDLDRERTAHSVDEKLLLSAFDTNTKASGFYFDSIAGNAAPKKLIMEDRSYSPPTKADNADVYMLTRRTFVEYPNLWITDSTFGSMKQMSDANPQQSEYSWGTAELVSWTSNDGIPLQGVLYKPENFSYAKRYPMIVYFYERLSDNLHSYFSIGPGGGSISIPFYVSRGYVVFTPDIPYKVGYPGESAMKAILPGVQTIISRGIADPKRIGLQGHSWGGYQIAYMVTQTDMFACAEAGAPVSNMFSAYGGIRYQSGMSRQFQYEKTQSRIGGSIWERPLQFIENSPIFWADKVNTPLLILHNDNDGAVPWTQGIEYFTALRRLGKPVWLVNYNGEGHGIGKRPNQKDWAVRMQQFFDHYLMGAPAPTWLTEGVPAIKKGRDSGLEIKGGG